MNQLEKPSQFQKMATIYAGGFAGGMVAALFVKAINNPLGLGPKIFIVPTFTLVFTLTMGLWAEPLMDWIIPKFIKDKSTIEAGRRFRGPLKRTYWLCYFGGMVAVSAGFAFKIW